MITRQDLAVIGGWIIIIGSIPLFLTTALSAYQACRRGQKQAWRSLLAVSFFPSLGLAFLLYGLQANSLWLLGGIAWYHFFVSKNWSYLPMVLTDRSRSDFSSPESSLCCQGNDLVSKGRNFLIVLLVLFAVYSAWIAFAYWLGWQQVAIRHDAALGLVMIAMVFGIAIEVGRFLVWRLLVPVKWEQMGRSLFFGVLYLLPVALIRQGGWEIAIFGGCYLFLLVRFIVFYRSYSVNLQRFAGGVQE